MKTDPIAKTTPRAEDLSAGTPTRVSRDNERPQAKIDSFEAAAGSSPKRSHAAHMAPDGLAGVGSMKGASSSVAGIRPETAKTERRAGILSGTLSAVAGIGGMGAALAGYLLGAAWPLTVGALTLGTVGLLGYLALISWRSPASVEPTAASKAA